MTADTDDLRAALERTRAELAATRAREATLRQELEADPELSLERERVDAELQAARAREAHLVDALKRARAERGPPSAEPRPTPGPEALTRARPGAPLAPARAPSARPRRVLVSVGIAACAIGGYVTQEASVALAGLAGVAALAFALRRRR